jgi:cold shock CspA family protein
MPAVKGVITTWKQEKAFGFIRPDGDGQDVFVHIRDFGAISRTPMVGDAVTYQPMRGEDGRFRAADVQIVGVPRSTSNRRPPTRGAEKKKFPVLSPRFVSALLASGALVAGSFHLGPTLPRNS